jgi:8-oxo-dGTP pyrophosphatase MutT (NUDIX family)
MLSKEEMNKNPWTKISEEEKYDNPWVNVSEHQVLTPNGNPGIYGVVHFKNRAVGVIPIDQDGNTYLVGQYRYTLDEYSWEIPEGGCPEGESLLDSAKRELLEETGLEAEQWTKILKMHTSNSVTDEVAYTFVATQLVQGEAMPEDTEELQLWKMPLEDAFEMAMNGAIKDAFSLVSLFKLQLMIKSGKFKL